MELMRQDAIHSEMPTGETAPPTRPNEAAIALLRKWMADESGYDEETWPELKKAIEETRLSSRPRFRD
jgi:hypothetical protein